MSECEQVHNGLLVPGSAVQVASTKYDGSLHYQYSATVVDDDGDRLRAWVPAGTQLHSYRGDRSTPRPFLRVHDRRRYWNLEVIWERNWRPRQHYVNIALPSTWSDGTLRFVDIDLDVSWTADGRVLLLDEDEFADHRERLGYPQWLVDRAWAAVDEVRGLISLERPPFDGSLYRWRPPAR